MSITAGSDRHHSTDIDPTYWDGRARSYIPSGPPRPFGCELYTDSGTEVDPITYEVLRYALLNTNFDHGKLLQRLCVSPIVFATRDFQTSILTESGEPMFLGPNVQYFSTSHQLVAQWVMENRSESPGLADGDQWLSNDPYVGSPHQQDTTVIAPVFVEGKLFCWVANAIHYSDVGGTHPGSFIVDAESVWDESPLFPPMKLVRDDVINEDVLDLFVRQSRLPVAVRMDVRAAVTGNRKAREQILELVDRYGAAVVKSAMNRTLDAAESLFAERLSHIPDGTWSHRIYQEASVPGDRNFYAYQVNITKRGDRLVVDNKGTDKQRGAINITYAGFSGAVLAAIDSAMVGDLAGAYGGAHRRISFEPESGLLNCCEHPSAVSSGVFSVAPNIHAAGIAVAKMLACGDDTAKSLIIGPGTTDFYTVISGGLDASGDVFVLGNTDGMLGAIAARHDRDGIDSGGVFWIPDGIVYNIEEFEAFFPVLFLYRRYLDAGADGAGKFRGGLGFEEALTPWHHTATSIEVYGGESASRGVGLSGGNPNRAGYFRARAATDFRARLRNGEVPQSIEELSGPELAERFRGPALAADDDTVWGFCWPTAAGYGDPLLREPETVAREVNEGLLTEAQAESVYGVVIRDGVVDEPQTIEVRHRQRSERLGRTAADIVPHPPGARPIGDVLSTLNGRWICGGVDLGSTSTSYRQNAVIVDRPVRQVAPEFASMDIEMADQIFLREYLCPTSGLRIDTELLRDGDEALADISLEESS